jgi:outer membrane protein
MAGMFKHKTKIGRGIHRALFGLLTTVFCFAANVETAHATLTTEQIKVYQSADESQRVHFLIGRAKAGQYRLAAELLRNFPLRGPNAVNRTLYIEGLILNAQGNLTGAVQKYRTALANDPKLTLVRSELAQTLVTLGEDDSAKHHLQLLEAEAPNANVAAGIRSFIDRIDAKRPFTFSGFVSVAPSTNVNNGSSHSTVYSANPEFSNNSTLTISPSSRKKSGIGAALGGSVGYSKRLGNQLEAVFAADAAGQLYDNSDFDSASLSQSAEIRFHVNQGYFGFGAVANEALAPNFNDIMSSRFSYRSYGPRVSMRYNLNARDLLTGSAVYERRDYAGTALLDAYAFLTEASWNHAIDSSLNFTVTGGYDKINVELKELGYSTIFGGLSVYKELPKGVTLYASTKALFSKFDDVNTAAGMVRYDQRYVGSIALTKRDLNIFGFAPSIDYTYTLNKSNIALWDYDSHAVDLRLTKDF